MAGRRTSLASLASAPVEDVPGQHAAIPVRLSPADIAATPFNPRQNFGDEQDLTELGESMRVRQLQPVVVVTAGPYLRLASEHAEQVGQATHVLVNGERRLRAARHVGLDGIDAVIRDGLTESRASFLDAVLAENLDRRNLNPIEEAYAVEAMVAVCGTAAAAAKQFRRHESWVSQRRALLKLVPELQELVVLGELPVRVARTVAALAPDDQHAAWRQAQKAEARQPASSEPNQDTNSAEIPGARTKAPSVATAGKMLRRFRHAYGAEAMADLVRSELDSEETITFITATAADLDPTALDSLLQELAALRARV